MSRLYLQKVLPIVCMMILWNVSGSAEARSPVYWEVTLWPTPHEITVKVVPRTRVREVTFQVEFFDEAGKSITVQTFPFTDPEQAELDSGKQYSKKFSHTVTNAKNVRGKLMFGKAALSSPKAAADAALNELEKGIPPLSE
jgi:hypothetical protein